MKESNDLGESGRGQMPIGRVVMDMSFLWLSHPDDKLPIDNETGEAMVT